MMPIRHGNTVVHTVCLHCLAVPTGWYEGKSANDVLLAVRDWHTAPKPRGNGWRAEGYHRLFVPNGEMAVGRSLYQTGAGAKGHNTGYIHLAMCETTKITRIGKFEDWFTRDQRIAVRDYLLELEELHGSRLKVIGHNDLDSGKLCPGFKVVSDEWL